MAEEKELDRVDQLKQMRDELRLQMHLAKAEAQEEWEKAEAKWEQLRQEIPKIDEATDEVIGAVSDGARRLIDEIRQAYGRIRGA